MPSGTVEGLEGLPGPCARLLEDARRGVLATIGSDGAPHVVPVCFAVRAGEILTGVDRKPKSGRPLARLENVARDPRVTFLVDRWDEDWTRLAWVMVRGEARIEPPGFAVEELAARYAQYRAEPPDAEVIVIAPRRVSWWTYH